MSQNDRMRIFIAYHGSYNGNEGSLNKAREIYNFLSGENGIDCYFFPETGDGFFGKTSEEALHSTMFLLVANKNICKKLNNNKEMPEGEPIYDEMNAFYQNKMHCKPNSKGLMRVYCYDGYSDSQADCVFPVATKNVEHFDEARDGEEKSFTKIIQWIENINKGSSYNCEIVESCASTDKVTDNQNNVFISGKNKFRFFDSVKYCIMQYSHLFLFVALFCISIAIFIFFLYPNLKAYASVSVFVLMFFLSLSSSFGMSFYRKFKQAGFSKIICSAVFGEAKPQRIMRESKRKIRFLGIASSKWLTDESLIESTIKRLCADGSGGIEFLLLNPESEYAKRMDLACKKGSNLTTQNINSCLKKITKIVKKICEENHCDHIDNFQIKLYSSFPIYRMVILDDEKIFLSFYETGSDGRKNTQIQITGKKKNATYKALLNYYNQLWNDDKTITYDIQ